jgi:hypothetical protein
VNDGLDVTQVRAHVALGAAPFHVRHLEAVRGLLGGYKRHHIRANADTCKLSLDALPSRRVRQ